MKPITILVCLAVALLLIIGVPIVAAQSGGTYELTWSTIDGGVGTSTSGAYSLTGTVGQPDAGATLSGGIYALAGGFWGGGATNSGLFLPLILR